MKSLVPVRVIVIVLVLVTLTRAAGAAEPRPERPFQGRVEAVWDNVFLALLNDDEVDFLANR